MQVTLSPSEVLTSVDLAFGAGLRDAVTYEVGGRTFVYFLGGTGGGLTAIEVLGGGGLVVRDETSLSGAFSTGLEPRLLQGSIDGTPSLILSGQTGATARSVELLSDGTFGASGVLAGDPTALIQPSLVDGPDGTYLVAGAAGGLQSFAVLPGSGLSPAAMLPDTTSTLLADVADTATVRVAGQDYVAVVSATEPGVTLVSVGAGGALARTGDIGAADGLGVSAASAVDAVEVMGQSFLVVAGTGSSSLSVIEVTEGGVPVLRDHVVDSLSTRFQSVESLSMVTIGDRAFVAAGGADDGVSLFELAPGGRLIHLSSLEDAVSTTLADVSAIALVARAGSLEVLVAGLSEPGLTRLSVDLASLGASLVADQSGDTLTGGGADDILVGGMAADALDGAAGDDILIDGGGSDTLTGGAGADLFVFEADGQTDTITDFELGIDRLDLSDFALLYGPGQLTLVAESWGVRVTWQSETIDIYSAGGGPLDTSSWTAADILNLDRPQFLPIAQILAGDGGTDSLRGGEGADTLTGEGGVDTLEGEGGADLIEAGTGNDLVFGGSGDDRLFGDAGFDTMNGGLGADSLWGGAQADSLEGGAGDDVLYGEGGVDNIFGGDGDDLAYGGSENDWLIGGAGSDTLYGDTQEDRLLGEDGADLLFGGAGFDRLEGGSGEDTLWGGEQADNLFGNTEQDHLYGEGGFDRLFGGAGDDFLWAGDGPDALFGEAGNDQLFGGLDDDRFFGGQGNDALFGEDGNDSLRGDAGFDTISGGAGDDTLTGNFNADTFVFEDNGGADIITDFDLPNAFEKIDLSALTAIADFTDLSANHLSQAGSDAVISDGAGTTITLTGIFFGDLTADDFIF